jgi:hypothetical protein
MRNEEIEWPGKAGGLISISDDRKMVEGWFPKLFLE